MMRIAISLLLLLVLSGCASRTNLVDLVADVAARTSWHGRPVTDVIERLGKPDGISPVAEKQLVILTYGKSVAYRSTEVTGTSRASSGGIAVNVQHYRDVTRLSGCRIEVSIDRERKVRAFKTKGSRCGAADYWPKRSSR